MGEFVVHMFETIRSHTAAPHAALGSRRHRALGLVRASDLFVHTRDKREAGPAGNSRATTPFGP